MRKAWLMVVVAMGLALLMALPAGAAGNLNVGYMSRQEVLSGFTRLQTAYRELELVKAPLEQQLKEKQEEIRQLQRELETNLLLSESRKQQLQEQIRNKMLALQAQAEENQRALTTQERAKIEPLMKVLEEAVKKVATAHGYNVVEDLADPVVIWVDSSLDIGKEVLAEINQ